MLVIVIVVVAVGLAVSGLWEIQESTNSGSMFLLESEGHDSRVLLCQDRTWNTRPEVDGQESRQMCGGVQQGRRFVQPVLQGVETEASLE